MFLFFSLLWYRIYWHLIILVCYLFRHWRFCSPGYISECDFHLVSITVCNNVHSNHWIPFYCVYSIGCLVPCNIIYSWNWPTLLGHLRSRWPLAISYCTVLSILNTDWLCFILKTDWIAILSILETDRLCYDIYSRDWYTLLYCLFYTLTDFSTISILETDILYYIIYSRNRLTLLYYLFWKVTYLTVLYILETNWLCYYNCSRSRRRAAKVDKHMVLVHTHGLFIT